MQQTIGMIKSCLGKQTMAFANAELSRRLGRPAIPDAAQSTGDPAAPRGNRPAPLCGDRVGRFNIPINKPWRRCFAWPLTAPKCGCCNIAIDTALRPGRRFGLSADFRMNPQKRCEPQKAARENGKDIERTPPRGHEEADHNCMPAATRRLFSV